jgi:hypothetical protein
MSRTGPSRRPKPANSFLAQWRNRLLIALGIASAIAGTVALANDALQASKLRSANSCADTHALAVDISDPLSDIQWKQLRPHLDKFGADDCTKEKIVVIGQFKPDLKAPFSVLLTETDPGAYAGVLSPTGAFASKKQRQAPQDRIRLAIDRAVRPDSSEQSLIIEGISYLSRFPAFSNGSAEKLKSLTIVTDLEQNQKNGRCSVPKYVASTPAERKAQTMSARCAYTLAANPMRLEGVSVVEILLIKRAPGVVPPEIIEFFDRLFRDAGARSVTIREIT